VIILDSALERRDRERNPIRVGLVGAGTMGRAIGRQLLRPVVGMELVAIASRDRSRAVDVARDGGAESVTGVDRVDELTSAIGAGQLAVTDDPLLLCEASQIDVLIETTGDIEAGARVTLHAVENGKHVVLVNAELDATLGPILRVRAERQGVVVSYTDGDEPGILMNLYRYVRAIGYRPVLAGNIKGLLDPYRTPDTQKEFAAAWGQKPRMVTSFADGTKLSLEMTLVANATGFRVLRRGMMGHRCAHVNDVPGLFDADDLLEQGVVDFLLGAEPGSGAFIVAHDDSPPRQELMRYFKLGDGPFYVFSQPWHLPHLEAPLTAARAVVFHDAAVSPLGGPVCEVIALAKRDLKAGEQLDGIGGFTCYGVIENSRLARAEDLLPIALSEDCILGRDIARDEPIAAADVEIPTGRLSDALFEEQTATFGSGVGN
jgi:predicted homoserine dehydrogenase-like protein